jgi:hypothetical protein
VVINLNEGPISGKDFIFIGKNCSRKDNGLRNTCSQIDHYKPGLLKAILN